MILGVLTHIAKANGDVSNSAPAQPRSLMDKSQSLCSQGGYHMADG